MDICNVIKDSDGIGKVCDVIVKFYVRFVKYVILIYCRWFFFFEIIIRLFYFLRGKEIIWYYVDIDLNFLIKIIIRYLLDMYIVCF